MCNYCHNAIVNNDIDTMIELMDLIEDHVSEYKKDECWKKMDRKLGNVMVEKQDAQLVLARSVGQAEPELYRDNSPDLYEGREQEFNQLIELKERMAKGLKMINEASAKISENRWAGFIYNAWVGKYDEDKCRKVLEDPRNKTTIKWIEYRDSLWVHYNTLKTEMDMLTIVNPALWSDYYKLLDQQDENYDWLAHKKSAPSVDNRMLLTDEAYYQGHMEEQQELFVYNY
jgi:hypothetical protein